MRGAWRKAARFVAYAAGALLFSALALVLALPWIVDQPRVHAALQERLSRLLHGSLAWEQLDLRLLPYPRGLVERLRVELPGRLSAEVARAEAGLELWPLLRGEVVLTALKAEDARIRAELQPAAAGPAEPRGGPPDPVAALHGAVAGAARLLQAHAPGIELSVERGSLDLRIAGRPPLELRALSIRGRSQASRAELQLACESDRWKRLELQASFDTATLAGGASVRIAGLDARAWLEPRFAPSGVRLALAPIDAQATLQSEDGKTLAGSVEARTRTIVLGRGPQDFEVPDVAVKAALRVDAQRAWMERGELLVEGGRLLEGSAEYALDSGEAQGRFAYDLDAARVLDLARRVLAKVGALQEVESATGRMRGNVLVGRKAGLWRAGLQLQDADSAWQLRRLPWPVQLRAGSAEWEPGRVSASGIEGSLGRSRIAGLGARLLLGKEPRLESAAGEGRVELDEVYPWLRQQPALEKALGDVPAVGGTLEVRLLRASGKPSSPDYELRVVPRHVRVEAKPLPGALALDGGEARLTPSSASARQVALALLDARATLSGSVQGIGTRQMRVQSKLEEGSAGSQAVNWGLAQAKAPPQLVLHAPFAFTADRLDWGPGRQLSLSTQIRFDTDTRVTAELAWQPDLLEVKRFEVQGEHGSGVLALRLKGRELEGRFSGTAHGAVLAYFVKDASRYAGRIEGDLRFAADLDRLRHARAEGRLSGDGVDLAWLAGRPLVVERFALEAQRDTARVEKLVVRAGKQAATVRGEFRRGERGPVLDASVESEGILLDDLLPREAAASAPGAAKPGAASPDAGPRFPGLWPLPVTGRVALRAGFLQRGHLRVAPVEATLHLEEERARLEVGKADLCGVSLPFTLEARREGWNAAARFAASKRPVRELAHCLSGGELQLTGSVELAAELETQGRAQDLVRNLKGRGKFDVTDGRMQHFALIGNILSLLNIADIAETVRGESEGFRFIRIGAAGQLRDGQFVLEEGVFDSPSARMAARGTIRLADGDSQITVLVAPLGRVDRVVRGIPIVGYVIGGTLTSIPVGVSGDIRSPLVIPLGPRAITEELLGVFQRALKLPTKLVPPQVSK